jgi:hypothetical protein
VVQEELSFSCKSDESTREVIRGIRLHFNKCVDLPVSVLGSLGGMMCETDLSTTHTPRNRPQVHQGAGRRPPRALAAGPGPQLLPRQGQCAVPCAWLDCLCLSLSPGLVMK